METLKSYKQYLSLKVRFGSTENMLEMLISTVHYAKEWKGPSWRVCHIIPQDQEKHTEARGLKDRND